DAAPKTPTAQDEVIHGKVETQTDDQPSRNGYHRPRPTVPVPGERAVRGGWFSSALAHTETGLIVAVPLAPVIATFLTVLMYIDPLQPSVWRDMTSRVPVILMIPGVLLLVWLILAFPLTVLRLGTAARANSGSHGQLNNRLLSLESYRGGTPLHQNATELDSALDRQLDFVWKSLQVKGPKWVL